MCDPCPFNGRVYVEGLSHIGRPEPHPDGRFVLLRRSIADTPLADGVGPWPYLWIRETADLDALHDQFRDLVTLTVVTQPGFQPAACGNEARFLKWHYVYDPSMPAPPMSRRGQTRLSRCERQSVFEVTSGPAATKTMTLVYDGLKHRRRLTGGLFDFPARHFESIASLPGSLFVRVLRDGVVGAMSCGVVFGGWLQILHTAISSEGLAWNASYLLMHGLQTLARERSLLLLTGGLPAGASKGLDLFKRRWANRFLPVYLLRIVNDPAAYARLCAARSTPGADFFPAYRSPAP